MKTEIVKLCKEHYRLNYKLEDITDCDGCLTEGKQLFSACNACPIRNCAREKKLTNCAYCPDYVCSNLEQFFHTEPTAKARLDKIRQ